MSGLFDFLWSDGNDSDGVNPKVLVEENRKVGVELADGTYEEVSPKHVHISLDDMTLWVDPYYIDAPPVRVHLPTKTKSAANNMENKSEVEARAITDVDRYSKITNSSDDPDKNVDLPTPYYEIWF